MTRRTRKTVFVAATMPAAAGLAGGGVAIAADGDEPPREKVESVVEEGTSNSGAGLYDREDCPEKDGTGGSSPSEPSRTRSEDATRILHPGQTATPLWLSWRTCRRTPAPTNA